MSPRAVKVAFLQATLGFGGAERQVQALMERLDPARVESLAITLYGPGPIGEQLAAEGHRVVSRSARGRWDPRAGIWLARALDHEGVDVLHVTDSALPLFWAGCLRRVRSRPRLVLSFHSWEKPGDRLVYGAANTCAFPVVDRFVALAPSHLEFLRLRHGLSRERFVTIGNGVDPEHFRPATDRSEACRAMGLDPHGLYVGIVASLVFQKDHPLFLRMARRVGTQFTEARFLIIGDGPEGRKLKAMTHELGLERIVSFLGARDDMPALYRALDLAVLCTLPRLEALPVSILEAMASGLPVVSTSVGSIADLVRDRETGLLVPSGDEASLVAAVGALLADSTRRARMGGAGRAIVEREYGIAHTLAAFESLYTQVAARDAGDRGTDVGQDRTTSS